MNMAIIYGSTTGHTQQAAHQIGEILTQAKVVSVTEVERFEDYDVLILGSSTWGLGELQDDWESAINKLDASALGDKKVALFGLGDQMGYPDTFVDAMGKIAQAATNPGAELIGAWPAEGYNFETSEALVDDSFNGLALDEENQGRLSRERITAWCELLKKEITA